ncbi:flagellar biosynthetic protein FlhB [Novimethylophilus kurashikiensis]|uniref:Flagellar biosynthetic protein FlhB n=1 Tax=Novimethylophilus kurashikiensis TaxID=1825523 RepID=A0A2R5FF61_9PROT|nr:flagellar biosynthesis protein FlhB [Novimethylophilus kurashikiensis]GBG15313.1 flagellar biosynthetic protein FlhB [Novimethylophilus kurashikiensis]
MAEDSDLERTESASPRRLEDARSKGNIPRSRELNTFAILIVGGTGLLMLGPKFSAGLLDLAQHWFTFDRSSLEHTDQLWSSFMDAVITVLMLFIPLMVVLIIAVLAAPMSIGGWLFSVEALEPDFGRLNPLKGITRMFSVTSLVELAKAVLKAVLVGSVGYWVVMSKQDEILSLVKEPVTGSIPHMAHMLAWTFILITGAMAFIVALDVPFQLWDYYRKLRMTKEEVRREAKESEGDPMLKGRIRAMQREAARKRMMSEVPKADVIVTNPTHYAVALVYRQGEMRAPRVVAKGSYLLAQRIRELGEENNVPILEAPPLARALYKHAELDQEIPTTLFSAVAEVLAYVYQLRSYNKEGGPMPQLPTDLPVPPGMDFEDDTA